MANFTRYMTALLLLAAAVAKGHAIHVAHVLDERALFWALLIGFEIALAVALIRGPFSRELWWWAFISFSMFSGRAFWATHLANPTCSCFGEFPIHPAVVLTVDLTILCGFIRVRAISASKRLTSVAVPLLVFVMCAGLVYATSQLRVGFWS